MELLASKELREEGFSLVELLVVIVIIGILSSIAVAAFMNQRKKAVDASMESDLRTIAIGVSTVLIDKTPKDLREIHGRNQSYVANIDYELQLDSTPWNDAEELPDFQVSRGNVVEIVVVSHPNTTWTDVVEPGDFCLAVTNPNSSYNYVAGSGQHINYDKILYYDVQAGGVKTMEELHRTHESGGELSCLPYHTRWVNAGGGS